MGEAGKQSTDNRKGQAIALVIVGVILFIAGICIATIHGTHLRGSGLGTAGIILGLVLTFAGITRAYYKRAQ